MPFSHGGKRPGTGRKRAEPTQVIRLPVSVIDRLKGRTAAVKSNVIELIPANDFSPLALPLYLSKVAAGFPSPGDNYVERRLDLNEHLIHHKEATFFVRVNGDSMTGAGVFDNDLLVVDRSLPPASGRIVIAAINGELLVKRLRLDGEKVWLVSENSEFAAVEITEGMEFIIWGVVTNVIHAL